MQWRWVLVGAYLVCGTSHAGEIEDLGQERLDVIKIVDLPLGEKRLKKIFGRRIRLSVDWNSFRTATPECADALAVEIQTVLRKVHELAIDPRSKTKVLKKYRAISFQNDPRAIRPRFICRRHEIKLMGNYSQMGWEQNGKKVFDMIAECL